MELRGGRVREIRLSAQETSSIIKEFPLKEDTQRDTQIFFNFYTVDNLAKDSAKKKHGCVAYTTLFTEKIQEKVGLEVKGSSGFK